MVHIRDYLLLLNGIVEVEHRAFRGYPDGSGGLSLFAPKGSGYLECRVQAPRRTLDRGGSGAAAKADYPREQHEERYDSPMTVDFREEPMATLPEYARVPISFTVDRVLDVTNCDDGQGGFVLSERCLEVPYEKDYDAIAGQGPLQWDRHFDLSKWGLFAARLANQIVGGAAVAFDTPGLTMLEERRDLAVLWDIRVAPDARRRGVGSALFQRVQAWAQLHGCRQLKIETQNTNVRACRFYERQGCRLRAINRAAYPELPDEIQLLWYKDLPC